MSNQTLPPGKSVADAMAEALRNAGIESDVPECAPNPLNAAFHAFTTCYQGTRKTDWDDFRESYDASDRPPAEYYRKLAEVCQRALRRYNLNDDLREPITFAWGYFTCKFEDRVAGLGTS